GSCGTPYRYSADRVPQVVGDPPFVFSAQGVAGAPLPDGFAVDSTTGEVLWTPKADQVGTHEIELKVSGPGGEEVQTLRITIECAGANQAHVNCGCSTGPMGLLSLMLLAFAPVGLMKRKPSAAPKP